jgi:cysteinyl-tRNA synthetase
MTDKLRFYNTKSKSVESFYPLKAGEVSIYSCGPTVYHYQHIGNMRAAVFADTLHRTLKASGYDVKHVINITDVGHLTSDGDIGEDKLEKGAQREGMSVWDVAKKYTDAYFKDLTLLNVRKEDYVFPRATDHIKEQIALIQKLEEKGYTYAIQDGVYFDTSKFPAYAEFAHLDVEGLKSGARVEENTEKRTITDFALWKLSPHPTVGGEQRQMEWDSPWGKGFPGWHIECSAMSMKYLGNHFDIHTGGIEHIPVHHTNEIAQSECATGVTFANYWLHNNHLLDQTGKMSKSNDDFLTLSSLIEKGYEPLCYRYFLMNAQYRKELEFSFEALDASRVAYEKLIQFCKDTATKGGNVSEIHLGEFMSAVQDDLNTAKAVACIWNMLKDGDVSKEDKYRTLMEMDQVLGLDLARIRKEEIILSSEMEKLLEERARARSSKDFAESDRLRSEIEKQGYTVKDTPDGQALSKE